MTYIKKSLDLDSDSPLTWFYLAQIYLSKGQVNEALNACHRSLKIYPENKDVLEMQKKINDIYFAK